MRGPVNLECPAFIAAKARRDALAADVEAASRAWNAIPSVGSGRMGLTPDAVKASPEYREARAAYERANALSRSFLSTFTRTYKRELRAEREARRERLQPCAS